MEKSQHESPDGFRLFARVEKLRGDENGSLTLLTGMMVFLVTIFAVIAFDTNMAIHNRILAQNAVDSAAESAALWQARGCNLEQQLNNLHYDVDEAACIAEGVAAGACIAAVALLAAEIAADAFFGAGEALRPIRMGVCIACDALPLIDAGQQLFYAVIMPIQEAIKDVIPFLAFGYANANAYGSGADPLLSTVADYIGGVGTAVGQAIPALQSVTSLMSGIGSAISSVLGSIPIYAAPLDPTSLELYVNKRDNDKEPPLYWPEAVGIAGEVAGYIGCSDAIPDFEEATDAASDIGWDENYGWDDQYYFGWPGFMTWIAGKDKHDELLGLGNLTWLNGGQNGTTNMFLGQATGAGSGSAGVLQIPAFVALASSQIQGTPVIMHGDVDAVSTLIKVYIPGGTPTSAEKFFIYH